jgi:hypothetical protein
MQKQFGALVVAVSLLLALTPVSLAAQGPLAVPAFVIRSVEFEITGVTQEYFLRKTADIVIGTTFPDEVSLNAYVADKAQLLTNLRVLESASIQIVLGERGTDGPTPVDLHVIASDTWNIIVLPYFKYDSNDGLLLSARGRDYNFFGTMQPLRLNLDWTLDTHGDQEYGLSNDFDLPFAAAGLDWTWSLTQSGYYVSGEPVRYSATTGVDLDLPFGPGTLTLGPSQSIEVNAQDSNDVFYDSPLYFNTEFAAKYSLPLPLEVGHFGMLTYTPYANISRNWWPGDPLDEALRGTTLGIGHKLSFGRVDWIGNLRNGLTADLSNDNTYNFDTRTWTSTISASASGYAVFLPFLGASTRLSAFYRFNDTDESAGSYLRGILDARMDTDTMVSLNLDLPVRVIRFVPSEWFGAPWMQFFEFEQLWSPFFDAAIGHFDGRWFNFADGWYSAGIEVITFPLKFRSFYVRISAGWDIPAIIQMKSLSGRSPRDDESMRELFIGIGAFY